MRLVLGGLVYTIAISLIGLSHSARAEFNSLGPLSSFPYAKSDLLISHRANSNNYKQNNNGARDKFIDRVTGWRADHLVWHYINSNKQCGINHEGEAACRYETSEPINDFSSLVPNGVLNCNIPNQVADPAQVHHSLDPNVNLACLDLYGNRVGNPWNAGQKHTGDIFNTDFLRSTEEAINIVMANGCTHIQQDNLLGIVKTMKYGGCFSEASDLAFNQYLNDNHSASEITNLIGQSTQGYRYSDHLRSLGAPAGSNLYEWWLTQGELSKVYENFLYSAQESYLQRNKDLASQIIGQYVSLSGNFFRSEGETRLAPAVDYAIAEYKDGAGDPFRMKAMINLHRSLDRAYVHTMIPEGEGVVHGDETEVYRKMFALTYALGAHILLPYDVYTGSNSPRYSAEVSEFSSISDFIKDNALLFDDYKFMSSHGSLDNYRVTSAELSSNGSKLVVKYSNRIQDRIEAGDKIKIGNSTFETIGSSNMGLVYLDPSLVGHEDLALNQPVHWIKYSAGDQVMLTKTFEYNKPLVTGLEPYAIGKVRVVFQNPLEDSHESIKAGTDFTITGTSQVFTTVEDSPDNRSLIISSSDATNSKVKIEKRIKSISSDRMNFQNKMAGPGDFFNAVNFDLGSSTDFLAVVRRPINNVKKKSIIHVLNWRKYSTRPAKISVDHKQVFGKAPSGCTVHLDGQSSQTVTPTATNGRRVFQLPAISTWAILECSEY